MSTMRPMNFTCSVCGHSDNYVVLTSTNAFGSPDLDLRPPQMRRGTMNLWLQECSECGYIAGSVEDKTTITREFLSGEKFLSCGGMKFRSALAERFCRHYLIAIEEGDIRKAFFSMLHAAWACDDSKDGENAAACRVKAIGLLEELLVQEPDSDDAGNLIVLKADLLRRAGRFDDVIEQYADFHSDEKIIDGIIRFQIAKAKEKDTACYRVADTIDGE